jgi:cell division septal protein FtsQ
MAQKKTNKRPARKRAAKSKSRKPNLFMLLRQWSLPFFLLFLIVFSMAATFYIIFLHTPSRPLF